MTTAKARSAALLALRASLGLLMVVWGADKFASPEHGIAVADRFYFGLPLGMAIMPFLGTVQVALGLGVVMGVLRRYLYPILAAATGLTLVGVWRSIVDPWGWYLEGTSALFFPSLIIFAGVMVVWAFRDEDTLSLDARRAPPEAPAL